MARQTLYNFFDGSVWVKPMTLQDVDVLDFKALKASLDRGEDILTASGK